MEDNKKFELHDDALDSVAGGVFGSGGIFESFFKKTYPPSEVTHTVLFPEE